ncbi:MAG: hypothetical protein ACRDNJ_16865 [Solirubrobacteraceae bacterium]
MAGFVALAAATIGAFFVVQHLKVTTPLINGFPAPFPREINPIAGGRCPVRGRKGRIRLVSFRRARLSFYLQGRADDVDVYVLGPDQTTQVAQIGDGVHMRVKHRHTFWWNGRLADGSVAPDGLYYLKVALIHQGRSFLISNQNTGVVEPITVLAHPEPLRVTSVAPARLADPTAGTVTVRYEGGEGLRPHVLIYRLRPGRLPALVKRYFATSRAGHSLWDGRIGGASAPPGTYLIALTLINSACTALRSPATRAAAPQAVVTIG